MSDFIATVAKREYEDAIDLNSTWATGDWNGDGDFTSRDLVFAFGDGGYEVGQRVATAQVPEPSSIALLFMAFLMFCRFRPEAWAVSQPSKNLPQR